VRRALIALLTVFTLAGLAGCGLVKDDEEKRIEKLLEDNPSFSVFLRTDVTDKQRHGVESYLRAMPGVAEVTYESSEQAYQRFQELWADSPEFTDQVDPDSLPQSFQVRMDDVDAVKAVRDGSEDDTIKALPGVQDVVIQCVTVDECKDRFEQNP
jgi:cell division transport system permease protein